jgi:hypothetical protein
MSRVDYGFFEPADLPPHCFHRRHGRYFAVVTLVLTIGCSLASQEALAGGETPSSSGRQTATSPATAPPPATPGQETGSKSTAKSPQNLEPMGPKAALPLLGEKVWGPSGEDMGMIVNVLVDADGHPRAAVIDFGGFLGVGTRKIAIDWRLLHFHPADSKIAVSLSLSRAQVQAAPEYKPASNSEKPAEVLGPPATSGSAPALPDAGE